jgi:hypothetical protein
LCQALDGSFTRSINPGRSVQHSICLFSMLELLARALCDMGAAR